MRDQWVTSPRQPGNKERYNVQKPQKRKKKRIDCVSVPRDNTHGEAHYSMSMSRERERELGYYNLIALHKRAFSFFNQIDISSLFRLFFVFLLHLRDRGPPPSMPHSLIQNKIIIFFFCLTIFYPPGWKYLHLTLYFFFLAYVRTLVVFHPALHTATTFVVFFFFSLQKITVEKDQTKKKEYYVSVFLVTSMPSSLPPPHQPKRRKTIKKPAGRLLSDAYFLSQIFQRPASSLLKFSPVVVSSSSSEKKPPKQFAKLIFTQPNTHTG